MKALDNSFSIVAVGAWNPAIFNGIWITENLLDDQSGQIGISFNSNPNLPPQIQFEGVRIFPAQSRLQIMAIEPTEEGILSVLRVFKKTVGLLSHTPIQSVGVNFGFVQAQDNRKLLSWIGEDFVSENAPSRYSFRGTQVTRQFASTNDVMLNVEVQGRSGDAFTLSYNFDYGMGNVKECISTIDESSVVEKFREALLFCEEVFELNLEEASDD